MAPSRLVWYGPRLTPTPKPLPWSQAPVGIAARAQPEVPSSAGGSGTLACQLVERAVIGLAVGRVVVEALGHGPGGLEVGAQLLHEAVDLGVGGRIGLVGSLVHSLAHIAKILSFAASALSALKVLTAASTLGEAAIAGPAARQAATAAKITRFIVCSLTGVSAECPRGTRPA